MVQKTVNLLPAIGVAGQKVATDSARYLAYQPLSDGTVKVGGFAFAKTNGNAQGAPFAIASGTGAESAAPLGFVERVMDATFENVLTEALDILPEGAVVTVAVQGQFYINVPTGLTGITAGMGVYVNPTTGAINLAASAGTGEVDTGFKVVIPNGGASAAAGDVVIIQRFN